MNIRPYSVRMSSDFGALLQRVNLRDTQPRRSVLQALATLGKPSTPKDVHSWITHAGVAINLVTVYRVLEKFQRTGVVHRHPSSGGVVLCSLTNERGHHVLLSCDDCGKVEERTDSHLCQHEDALARSAGFAPRHHVSEIVGVCSHCQ